MITESQKKDLLSQLKAGCNVVISTHKSPDGDAIGSSTALALYLEQKGCNCKIVVPDPFPKNLQWIPGAEEVLMHTIQSDQINDAIDAADIIFSLDYNDLSRAGEIGSLIANSDATKVLIDHHEDPKGFADIEFHNAKCCSTAQLVFEFIEQLGDKILINVDIAKGLYTGIITDTGSFRYPSVDEKTHEIAQKLIALGLDHTGVHESIYGESSIDQLQLNGFAVSERLEVLPNGKVAIIYLTNEDLKRFNAQKGYTEGLVNKALSISGVTMAAFFREEGSLIKISFRSKGSVYVNNLAKNHFGGGGHKYAAGGSTTNTMSDTLDKFKKIVMEYV